MFYPFHLIFISSCFCGVLLLVTTSAKAYDHIDTQSIIISMDPSEVLKRAKESTNPDQAREYLMYIHLNPLVTEAQMTFTVQYMVYLYVELNKSKLDADRLDVTRYYDSILNQAPKFRKIVVWNALKATKNILRKSSADISLDDIRLATYFAAALDEESLLLFSDEIEYLLTQIPEDFEETIIQNFLKSSIYAEKQKKLVEASIFNEIKKYSFLFGQFLERMNAITKASRYLDSLINKKNLNDETSILNIQEVIQKALRFGTLKQVRALIQSVKIALSMTSSGDAFAEALKLILSSQKVSFGLDLAYEDIPELRHEIRGVQEILSKIRAQAAKPLTTVVDPTVRNQVPEIESCLQLVHKFNYLNM